MNLSSVIQKRLKGRMRLTTLPRVAQRVRDSLEHGDANLGDIGTLIALDPPLTARLLRSVNSALYGLSTEVFEPEHAASILGVRGLRNLILRAPVMDSEHIMDMKRAGFDPVELWRESIRISRLAVVLGRALPIPCEPDRVSICGLLSNLGRFALAEALGEEYAEACFQAKAQERALSEVEKEAFGFAHTELGAMLAARWSLPDDVIKAARFHHNEKGLAEVDPLAGLLMASSEVAVLLGERRDLDSCFPRLRKVLPKRTVTLLGLDKLEEVRGRELASALVEELDDVKV